MSKVKYNFLSRELKTLKSPSLIREGVEYFPKQYQ